MGQTGGGSRGHILTIKEQAMEGLWGNGAIAELLFSTSKYRMKTMTNSNDSHSVRLYLVQIGKHPLLTAAEELD